MSPITCYLKKGAFTLGGGDAHKAFEKVKELLCATLVLALPNFSQPFEVECNASGIGIGVVLVHGKRPITYFS